MIPCPPGWDAEPGGQKRVDAGRLVRLKDTEIFPPTCSFYSNEHWAKLSIVMAQHPGRETSDFSTQRENRESSGCCCIT